MNRMLWIQVADASSCEGTYQEYAVLASRFPWTHILYKNVLSLFLAVTKEIHQLSGVLWKATLSETIKQDGQLFNLS
jgi:hypothetical protein